MFENSIKTASPDLPRPHDVASNFHFLSVFFIIIVFFFLFDFVCILNICDIRSPIWLN